MAAHTRVAPLHHQADCPEKDLHTIHGSEKALLPIVQKCSLHSIVMKKVLLSIFFKNVLSAP